MCLYLPSDGIPGMHLSAHPEPGRLLALSQGLSPMEHCPQPTPVLSIEPHTPGKAAQRSREGNAKDKPLQAEKALSSL